MYKPVGAFAIVGSFLTNALPLAAQDNDRLTAEEALENAKSVWSIKHVDEREEQCAQETDDPDVIVVCREWESGERYTFERPPDRPVGADVRTAGNGAPRPPDFNESCLHNRGRQNCIMLGSTPPPAIMVDFDALPETPEGSDAARLYGGPTTASPVEEEEDVQEAVDTYLQTQQGITDDTYGP